MYFVDEIMFFKTLLKIQRAGTRTLGTCSTATFSPFSHLVWPQLLYHRRLISNTVDACQQDYYNLNHTIETKLQKTCDVVSLFVFFS